MSTEMWFRNPSNYIRELLACNVHNIIFDYGWMIKRGIVAADFIKTYLSDIPDYRVILCGEQGSPEYRPGSVNPVATYPTWQYGESESELETLMAKPIEGQEHRVIVMNFPHLGTLLGKHFLKFLGGLQEDYPDCILHIHGVNGLSQVCSIGFRSTDINPRERAAHGVIMLPTGLALTPAEDNMVPHAEWIKLLGFNSKQLLDPRERCKFNILSSIWSGKYFNKETRLVFKSRTPIDIETPDAHYSPEENNRILFKVKVKARPGDRIVCNACALSMGCKFYREGCVCAVPASEPKELSTFFKTRNADTIIEGMLEILSMQAQRLQDGRAREELMPEAGLDPEVTRIAKTIVDQGGKVAMIIDPSLRPRTGVQVNVGSGGQAAVGIGNFDAKQLIGKVIRDFELAGVPRNEITPGMIEAAMKGAPALPMPKEPMKVIEAIHSEPIVIEPEPSTEDTELPF